MIARTALVLALAATGLAGCGGSDPPATKLSGNCAAGHGRFFGPLTPATVQSALGAGSYTLGGLVFPKQDGVPEAGSCVYGPKGKSDRVNLTIALNRKTPFFTSFDEARRVKRTDPLAAPIAGLDGYTVEGSVANPDGSHSRSVWAVVLQPPGQIVWASITGPPSSRDLVAAVTAAVRQAVRGFRAPMKTTP